MKLSICLVLLALILWQCRPKQPDTSPVQFAGKPGVPSSIKAEHELLLRQMHHLTLFQDSTGIRATALSDLMKNHFQEEEDFVLPPLGLLPSLSVGHLPEAKDDIALLIEKFRSQSAHMSAEHQLIKAFFNELREAANEDGHPEVDALAEAVHKHAEVEEQVYYPTVILIGDYLKLRGSQDRSPGQ
ncbi:MAG TPA: hemerythrin domain-containing protein [Chryseosolibacter sp.]|nr:hemerythrin domain-containing protein [Chryseosolibacter sp.]